MRGNGYIEFLGNGEYRKLTKDKQNAVKTYVVSWDDSCQGTVPVAMRCFYESNDYESFILNIYSLKCDSDTFGAIAGGVAEEFYHGFGSVNDDGILKDFLAGDLYKILMA